MATIKMPPEQSQNKKRFYQQHRINTLKKALALVGSVDEWPAELKEAGEALQAKRARMIKEQGGEGVITEVERDAIDAKLQTTVLRQWVWNYIKGMECPVNKVKRKPFPVAESFVSLVRAESEASENLSILRQKRPKPEPLSLNDYITTNGKKPVIKEEPTPSDQLASEATT